MPSCRSERDRSVDPAVRLADGCTFCTKIYRPFRIYCALKSGVKAVKIIHTAGRKGMQAALPDFFLCSVAALCTKKGESVFSSKIKPLKQSLFSANDDPGERRGLRQWMHPGTYIMPA